MNGGRKVYSTPEGYIGYWQVLRQPYPTGQKGGDGGNSDVLKVLMKVIVAIHVLCSICKRLVRMRSFFHSGSGHGSLSLL